MLNESRRMDLLELGFVSCGGGEEEREPELTLYRSGSAPRTIVGGSSSARLVDDDYFLYCNSNANRNPRLALQLVSEEDLQPQRRVQAGGSVFGGIGSQESLGRRGDRLTGQRSYTGLSQDGLGSGTALFSHISHTGSRTAFDDVVQPLDSVTSQLASNLDVPIPPMDGLQLYGYDQTGVQNIGTLTSYSFASSLGPSIAKGTCHDSQLMSKARSPYPQFAGMSCGATNKKTQDGSSSINIVSPVVAITDDLVGALSSMNLSLAGIVDPNNTAQSKLRKDFGFDQNFLNELKGGQNYSKETPSLKISDSCCLSKSFVTSSVNSSNSNLVTSTIDSMDWSNPTLRMGNHTELCKHIASNLYTNANSAPSVIRGVSTAYCQNGNSTNSDFSSHEPSRSSINSISPSVITNHINIDNLPQAMNPRALGRGFSSGQKVTGATNLQNLNRTTNHVTLTTDQVPFVDPLYLQYLTTDEHAAQAATSFSVPSLSSSYAELVGAQKACHGALLQPQQQYDIPFLCKIGAQDHGYYGQPAFGQSVPYPERYLANPILPTSPIRPDGPLRHGERDMSVPSGQRQFNGGIMVSRHTDTYGESYSSSLLDEFKSNRTRCYELYEIVGHVVVFSVDQFGSRFIQQKLETASNKEKNMVFQEIMPQALTLMTDVFGNYVVQKLLENEIPYQIRELAKKLNGRVLALSLHMYGCRVIQKALEVVDLEQKIKMAMELDGHIMRCVRDQNGNHVIQKCIECIPQDAIYFIISTFNNKVVATSIHAYGCRVIQRILEYCDNPKTQQFVMDEIMQDICTLAQDQYGNYVIQHVLEHGKPHERSAIIKTLAGQIVHMSQQKFASNVVEKCLIFGDYVERQILIKEMLGSTDENEPLQAMMKDQFGNYVVQRVLDTCDDQQCQLLLSRIKVHLNTLKKYTYGMHLVSRVEKIVAAAEKRIRRQSSYAL